MILKIYWLAGFFLLLFEGFSLILAPQNWRARAEKICGRDPAFQRLGLIFCAIAAGLILIWALFPAVFWLAAAVFFLFEGLIFRFTPTFWQEYIARVLDMDDRRLRLFGVGLIVIALIVLALLLLWRFEG